MHRENLPPLCHCPSLPPVPQMLTWIQVPAGAMASATVVPEKNVLLALGSARSAPPSAIFENDFSLAASKVLVNAPPASSRVVRVHLRQTHADVAVHSRIVRPVPSGSRDMDPGTVSKRLSVGHVGYIRWMMMGSLENMFKGLLESLNYRGMCSSTYNLPFFSVFCLIQWVQSYLNPWNGITSFS
ncbi:hypothetical protein FB451DRAFT_1368582 [Mycena latifolia]|nr:hypothetical protein FB451DRAFT_1368582 [Mycena latifolia]